MRIIENPDREYAQEVRRQIKSNSGYCPCSLVKTKDTKCMCRDFREMEEGLCQCGLYIKVREENEANHEDPTPDDSVYTRTDQ